MRHNRFTSSLFKGGVTAAVMVVTCVGATEISIQASKHVAASTLAKDKLIHSNRGYCYRQVPKELEGKHYLMHDHKAVSDLNVKVQKGGDLYICIFDGENTGNLKSGIEWKKISAAITADSNNRLSLYKATVREGQSIRLPALNRWGTVVIADKISNVKQVAAKGSPNNGTNSNTLYSNDTYDSLKKLITDYDSGSEAQKRLAREAFNSQSLILSSDKNPVDVVLRRSYALLEHIEGMNSAPSLKKERSELDALKKKYSSSSGDEELRKLFDDVKTVRRRIAFRNPLLDFDRIIFLKHNKMARGEQHMVDQYLGFVQDQRGGVYVLKDPFSNKPEVAPLLSGSKVVNGRLKGRELHEKGAFISLELDYEAEHVYFAFTEGLSEPYEKGGTEECRRTALKNGDGCKKHGGTYYAFTPERNFAIFRSNADGSEITAMTDDEWNNFDPCVLPSGRIAFISDRIGGNQRCGGRFCSTYTLHGMMPDGSDIIPFSYHDTNEWQPSVDNKGMIIYTRWDYVDRDSDVAHHIWHCFPDGRDPRSYHGNYPLVREMRPWMEMSNRAIPGSHKYIGVAAPHHGENYGSLVMIDIREKDDGAMSQLKRITPEVQFPEAEAAPGVPNPRGRGGRGQVYGQPWPLSENFYLCSYSPFEKKHGLYLVDAFGNKELIFQDDDIGIIDPMPFRSRPKPPVIAVQTRQAKADRAEDDSLKLAMGTVTIMNIYESERPWPEDRKIKSLRVVNVFAKPNIYADKPNIGYARQSLCRGVLGTVPVEEDGSVHFECPTGVPVYFQALDENGMMIQNMRSVTYLHPGESLSCIGCHEDKHKPMQNYSSSMPIAMRRAPSVLKREPSGSYPLTFPRLVQPVLDAKCVSCHEKEKNAPSLRGDKIVSSSGRTEGFETLRKYAWGKSGGNGSIRSNGRSYSIPGDEGFVVSGLYKKFVKSSHKDVKLTEDELRRISLWVDCNSNFYGAYVDTEQQARGDVVQPLLGLSNMISFDDLKQ